MAVLSRIADTIDESTIDWSTIATKFNFNRSLIQQIQSKNQPTKEFVDLVTIRLWEDIFNYFGINSNISSVNALGIKKLAKILSTQHAITLLDDQSERKSRGMDVMHEVSMRVAKWMPFARVLGFPESYISQFEKNFESYLINVKSVKHIGATWNIFKENSEKNKYLMNDALKMIEKKNLITYPQSWKFWKNYLEKFKNGREVIAEMERYFPQLIAEVSNDIVHETTSANMTFIGHPLQHESFQISKTNAEIPVNVGSSSFQMIDLQQHSDWLETQERYMDVFNLFKDKVVFNFHDLEDYCLILNTLEQFINDKGGNGFATKGYHLVDHLKLFDGRFFQMDNTFMNYFCFLGSKDVVINFTKCDNEPGHGLYYSSQNIQIMNALHKELQSKDIMQVNVLVHNDDDSVNFCRGCIENNLYIKEDILTDIEKFKLWFNNLETVLYELKQRMNMSPISTKKNDVETLKKDMITYEALHNTGAFPTFSNLPEDQMIEIGKIFFLTQVQFSVLHTNHKHIILRGPYGSGKSIVLEKKLDQCIQSLSENELIYHICHDQQSKYIYCMKMFVKKNHNKHIITCSSTSLPLGRQYPSLSVILNHIQFFWTGKTVHIFIDEFSGSFINKDEITALKAILPEFSKSYIVISLQSMEEHAYKDESNKVDLGYQYDFLEKNTSFVLYNLDYSLRCALEINEFVNTTSKFIERQDISGRKLENFYDKYKESIVDKEYGQEENFQTINMLEIKTALSYNIPNKHGHFSSSGPVSIYLYDKFMVSQQKKTVNLLKSPEVIHPCPANLHITILEFILSNNSDCEKFVICTYDRVLYNSIFTYLKRSKHYVWTSEVKSFMSPNSKFDILLTDYASVRGCEFTNFIFLLRMGSKYLKYRMIECFTRATTTLHVIADNIEVSNKSSPENQLIKLWKGSSYVQCFDCKYDQVNDMFLLSKDGNIKHLKSCSNQLFVAPFYRFPWSRPETVVRKDRKANNNISNDLYKTIHYLFENNNRDIVHEFCVINKAKISNYQNTYNESLLHHCVRVNDVGLTRYLLSELQLDVEIYDSFGQTPLHSAAAKGLLEMVKLLIKSGANINSREESGKTPLHRVAEKGCITIAQFLIDNHADIHAKDNNGWTPLHYASLNSSDEVGKLLLNYNANIHEQDNIGQTPLHCSAKIGSVEVVSMLIDNDANIDAKDNDGRTPLHHATKYGRIEVIKLLIDRKVNINETDSYGQTPLHYSACFGHIKVTMLLVDSKANIHVTDNYGNTPFVEAAKTGNIEILKILTDK